MTMENFIGLMDCNNFFVSCERLFRPDLLGKPVIVLSSNDGCVVARSQEVKDMGIPMGIPVFKIKEDLKKGKVVQFSTNFALYRDISARVMNVLRTKVQKMEQYSVDESFFTLPADIQDSEAYLLELKQYVEQMVGIPVSFGFAQTKTLAKVAGGLAKKGSGVHILQPEAWITYAKEIRIGELWGVGRGLSARFTEQSVITPYDLMQADSAQITKVFGVVGARLQSELKGDVVYPVTLLRSLQQSITSSRSFAKNEFNQITLERALIAHIEHVVKDIRTINALAGGVSMHVLPSRYGDFVMQGIQQEIPLSEPTDSVEIIIAAVIAAFRSKYQASVPYKKAGVVLKAITPKAGATGSLFSIESKLETTNLSETISSLQLKFGQGALSFAGASIGKQLTARQYSSGSQTTAWSDIPSVKAK